MVPWSPQDCLVPYMTDERHPEDTIFFIFENDWRAYPHDDIPPDTWVRQAAGRAPGSIHEVPPPPPTELEPAAQLGQGRGAKRSAPPAPEPGRFSGAESSHRPTPEDLADVSPELVDLVLFANAATRAGVGSIQWLGWNADQPGAKPNPKKWRSIEYGSQLLAVSPFGAKHLGAFMARAKPTHIDLWLKELLTTDDIFFSMSCMAVPPFGGFSGFHTSLNLKGARRPSSFGEPWVIPGTTTELDDSGRPCGTRDICKISTRWQKPGRCVERVPLPPVDDRHWWRTSSAPRHPLDDDEVWQDMLQNRTWVHEGQWLGPFFQIDPPWWDEPEWKGLAKGKGKTREQILASLAAEDYWRQLQEAPESQAVVNKIPRPLSRLGLELAMGPSQRPLTVAHKSRAGRETRWHREQYCHRFFVPRAENSSAPRSK